MDTSSEKKIEVMNNVLTKMEDIENTQKSLIEKLGQVEVDLFEIKSNDLDKKLEEVHGRAGESYDIIKEAINTFEMKKNAIELDAV